MRLRRRHPAPAPVVEPEPVPAAPPIAGSFPISIEQTWADGAFVMLGIADFDDRTSWWITLCDSQGIDARGFLGSTSLNQGPHRSRISALRTLADWVNTYQLAIFLWPANSHDDDRFVVTLPTKVSNPHGHP